jgi:Ca2+/Na+ antiporter
MGTKKGNRVDKVLYYFGEVLYKPNLRRFNKLNIFFTLGFFVFIASAFTLFWMDSITSTFTSLLVMFLAVCVMVICMSYEYVFGEEDEIQQTEKKDTVDKNNPFEGDVFK